MLFELESVRDAMFEGSVHDARHYLKRVHTIEKVLVEQINVIESMSPQDFLEFRTKLAPASGFQSVQFREIEFISGLKDEAYIARLTPTDEESERMQRRLDEPTLWDAFCALLENRGLPMPVEDEAVRRESLLKMARDRDRYAGEFALSEDLVTHDSLVAQWRHRHVLMVERQIGTKSGTGGSTGAPYLRSTLGKRFYPDLWGLRSHL